MLNRLKERSHGPNSRFGLAAVLVFIIVLQSACFSKKANINLAPTSTIRIAFFPFNMADSKADYRWMALAAPILLEKASWRTNEFEIVPLWQSMPAAIQAAGKSRSLTSETVESASTWVSAKWGVIGEFTPDQNDVDMMIDFIPNQGNLIAFRYLRSEKMEWIESSTLEAIVQFKRYLMIPQLAPVKAKKQDMASLQSLAEAINREYGWFGPEEPGQAQGIVAELVRTDENLARFLFSPTLYPILAPK